jgi:hypothetical protein
MEGRSTAAIPDLLMKHGVTLDARWRILGRDGDELAFRRSTLIEEFRQVGAAEKKAEGTGLGLTLSRKFVELCTADGSG